MIGFELNEKTYVWTERIDRATLILKKTRDVISGIINGLVIAFVLGCFAYFIYDAVIVGPAEKLASLDYWLRGGMASAAFWLAALGGMFLFYRLSEAVRHKLTVEKRQYESEVPEIRDLGEETKKSKVNVARAYSTTGTKSVEEAYELAERFGQTVEPLHLFVGTLSTDPVKILFVRLGLSFETVKAPLNRKLNGLPKGKVKFSDQARETLLAAYLNAYEHGRELVGPVELFLESYRRDEFIQELFYGIGIESEQVENAVAWIRIDEELRKRYEEYQRAASRKPTGAMNRAYTAVATPMLDQVSEDLTVAGVYGRLPMLVDREQELESIFRVIEGGNESVVLVGPPGVGKQSIVYGIAERMVSERVPQVMRDKRLIRLSIPHLTSGASPEVVQERLLMVLNETARSKNIILVIENIEQITGLTAGGEMSVDLASVLIDALNRRFTFLIATTTPEAYASAIERTALGQVLQKVRVDEPEINEAIQILEAKIGVMEYKNKVIFSYAAVEEAVKLSDRYMHDQYLPDKAIEICEETALAVNKAKGANSLVAREDVARIISEKTKIPMSQVAEEEKAKLLKLEEVLHERMIGQNDAVDAVASALRRARTELRSDNRPIANFLFLGPTGVGKTELAKTTAEAYFGREESMIRFDMSEYQNESSITRLIGGKGEGGLLTEAVRENPFTLLLLDELEKAHPDILNLFLQVMDDGRLTDGAGRTIDFTNVILIATSNAGTEFIQSEVKKGTPLEQIKNNLIEEELKGVYRPEFLNRFDAVIVFKPLTMDEVVQIAYLMIGQVEERLEAKGIHFKAEDAAVQELAEKGFDPKFGARPLRRVIQNEVDDAVARVLLEDKATRRDTIVLKHGGKIEIEKAAEL